MAKVTVQVVTVQKELPAGVVAGALRFQVLDANGVVVQGQDVGSPSAVFSGVADGDYVASVVRLDANGNTLGDTVTANFTVATAAPVAPAPVMYDAPASLSVLVEAE